MNKEKLNSPLLRVENLTKSFYGRFVVNGLTFHIYPGSIVGLLGPNGAGKTTAFYMTMGLLQPTAGSVFFQDQDISSMPVHKRAQLGMGYLAQEPSIFLELSCEDNLRLVLEYQGLHSQNLEEKCSELLKELHLTHLRKQKAATLSGGERRRLEITRTLASNPKLLLLDEPFANVDPITISEMKRLTLILKQKGISVLITDHNAREIFSIADSCYLIQEGKVALSGTPEQLINNEIARKSYLGEDFVL